jgi:hypothetical protein
MSVGGKPLTDWLRELDEENRDLATGLGYGDLRVGTRQVRGGTVQPTSEASEALDDGLPRAVLRCAGLAWATQHRASTWCR